MKYTIRKRPQKKQYSIRNILTEYYFASDEFFIVVEVLKF